MYYEVVNICIQIQVYVWMYVHMYLTDTTTTNNNIGDVMQIQRESKQMGEEMYLYLLLK